MFDDAIHFASARRCNNGGWLNPKKAALTNGAWFAVGLMRCFFAHVALAALFQLLYGALTRVRLRFPPNEAPCSEGHPKFRMIFEGARKRAARLL